MQFFLLIYVRVYSQRLYSLGQKNKLTSLFAAFNTQLKAILCRTSRKKNSYAMHTIKITPNLLFEYQCTSGKFIRLPNPIESKKIDSVARIEQNRIETFLPELECSTCRRWWRSTVVERRSLTDELSLSCARPAANG